MAKIIHEKIIVKKDKQKVTTLKITFMKCWFQKKETISIFLNREEKIKQLGFKKEYIMSDDSGSCEMNLLTGEIYWEEGLVLNLNEKFNKLIRKEVLKYKGKFK